MSHRFPHLAQKLFNTPLMIHPQKAEIVMAALADRLGIAQILHGGAPSALAPDLDADVAYFSQAADYKPYAVIEGIAIIPVEGTLVQKSGGLTPWSGMTGYDGIRACTLMAIEDPDVRAIALQIDSPGGEVAGCFDLADTIAASSARAGGKPVWAVLDECACSAAYALASAADFVTIPRTGIAGSIGVIAMLVDLSAAMSQAGVKVNIVQFGAQKADGNQFEPLPAAARARFQAQIDMLGELFVVTVARNRRLTTAAIAGTEAGVFTAAEALHLGLVDAIMSPDAALDALIKTLGPAPSVRAA